MSLYMNYFKIHMLIIKQRKIQKVKDIHYDIETNLFI